MSAEQIAEAFTNGFNYSVKKGKMTLDFFCDCCGAEIKVEKTFDPNTDKNQHALFEELKKEMDGKFHRCEKCKLLICQSCFETKDVRCSKCTICFTPET